MMLIAGNVSALKTNKAANAALVEAALDKQRKAMKGLA